MAILHPHESLAGRVLTRGDAGRDWCARSNRTVPEGEDINAADQSTALDLITILRGLPYLPHHRRRLRQLDDRLRAHARRTGASDNAKNMPTRYCSRTSKGSSWLSTMTCRTTPRPTSSPQWCRSVTTREGGFAGSTVLRDFNAGDLAGAKAGFALWNEANGQVVDGLVATSRR